MRTEIMRFRERQIKQIVVLSVLIGAIVSVWHLKPDLNFFSLGPKSDVPITRKIGWINDARLSISSIEAKVLSGGLNTFKNRALVQYIFSRSMKYKRGFRPYVDAVQITERWDASNNSDAHVAIVELIPQVGFRNDAGYSGDALPFTIKVQDYVYSGGWGKNIYNVSILDKKSVIELVHSK